MCSSILNVVECSSKQFKNLGSKYPLPCDYIIESIIYDMANVFNASNYFVSEGESVAQVTYKILLYSSIF